MLADAPPRPSAEVFRPVGADAEDVRLSQNGDPEAYRRLVERHQQAVAKIMWRFTRDRLEHEELTHNVFVEAYMSIAGYKHKAPFEHWLARIATRVGYRYWCDKSCDRQADSLGDDAWQRIAGDSEDDRDRQEAAELVRHLLSRLPARDRLVITLRYLQQHDTEQTAYLTGWSKTSVRVRTHRAMKKLQKLAAKANIRLER